MRYHRTYFRFMQSFYDKYTEHSDSETAQKLLQLINSHRKLLKAQLAFVDVVMEELYKTIQVAKCSVHRTPRRVFHRSCKVQVEGFWTSLPC